MGKGLTGATGFIRTIFVSLGSIQTWRCFHNKQGEGHGGICQIAGSKIKVMALYICIRVFELKVAV